MSARLDVITQSLNNKGITPQRIIHNHLPVVRLKISTLLKMMLPKTVSGGLQKLRPMTISLSVLTFGMI